MLEWARPRAMDDDDDDDARDLSHRHTHSTQKRGKVQLARQTDEALLGPPPGEAKRTTHNFVCWCQGRRSVRELRSSANAIPPAPAR